MTGTDDRHSGEDRREELIAAAATDDLTPAERREYHALLAVDPEGAETVWEMRRTLEAVSGLGGWREEPVPSDLRDRVLTATAAETPDPDLSARRSRATPRRWPLVAAAVALVALGAGVGVGVERWSERPPSGGPGTLGAVEEIDFRDEAGGPTIDAALVAHTWGTETVLEMDGFAVGERFEVVLLDEQGEGESSGTFLGSQVTVLCRMNAALLREDVAAVEIRDEDGAVVARSQVPDVEA